MWLRAEGYTAGAANWTDNSGNGRNASRTGTITNTTLYNFQNVPTNLSTTRYFSVAHHVNLNTNNGAISVFAVGLPNATYAPFVSKTNNQFWEQGWILSSSDPVSHLGFTTGNWDGTGSTNVAKQTGVSTTIPYIASGFGSGATTNVVSVNNNGTAVVTNTSTKTSSNVPLRIGFDGDAYGFGGGNIAEVIMYNSDLSVGDRQRVWSYLALKYGITLNNGAGANYISSGGTTIWDQVTNAGYNANIFGIGRDNTSGLHQRQSVSINGGLQPVIGHGTTLVNLNSSGTDLGTNNSFLIAGSNNGATAFNTALSGITGLTARLGRIWKVQESGTVGTVTIAWPDTDASIRLVVSNDAVFNGSDNAIATTATTINGVAYRQANVDLTSGQFFTFAANILAPGGQFIDLALWLASDAAGVAPGSNAPDWDDISKTNNPVETVGTRTLQNADAAHNFQPFFNNFSATDHFKDNNSSLAPENLLQTTEVTMFAVARLNSATNDGRIMGIDDGNNNGGDPGLSIDDASPRFHRVSTSTVNYTSPLDATVGRSGIHSAYTTGTTLGVGVDGDYRTTTITAGGGIRGDILMIGYGNLTVVGALPGDLQEVIWYKRGLSDTERKQVETYLCLKHGITLGGNAGTTATFNYLNSAGSTLWSKTGNAGFNNDITGIARDDASRLDQRQSTNASGASAVTIALGTIAASNSANTTAFSQDRSALIWGHDGGAANTVFNDAACFSQLPSGVEARIQRRWKVQATNFAQSVTVAFDEGALVGDSPVNNLRLLVDDDGSNWTNATVISGATSAGGRILFTGVSLTNGSFFTLGTSNFASTPLPVELIAFEGAVDGAQNRLWWSTATETENDRFEVERSADGATFEWLADVQAAGNSNHVTNYALMDTHPLNGLNYYRLMQVDTDGSTSYSPVIVLENAAGTPEDCVIRTVETDGLYVLQCAVPETATLELFTQAGQPVRSTRFNRGPRQEVDLRAFASGIYFVRIIDGAVVRSYKLVRP
ncbi:MAG: hypothetical protein ACO1NQ_14035 [Flavobacteriales bacterium]